MGTSVSFRSPNTPRWRAVAASYESADSLDRVRSELFNAGESWSDALGSRELLPYLNALTSAWGRMADTLHEVERPDLAIRKLVADARAETLAISAPPALAITERALQHTLVAGLRTDRQLSETSVADAAAAWVANRGRDPAALVRIFLGEVLRQFALHAVSRDAAHILRSPRADDAGGVRDVTRALAESARRSAESVDISLVELQREPSAAWATAVRAAFDEGRRIPHR